MYFLINASLSAFLSLSLLKIRLKRSALVGSLSPIFPFCASWAKSSSSSILEEIKNELQPNSSHKIQSPPSNTFLNHCKSKDGWVVKYLLQSQLLISDKLSMKRQPKVILLGDTNVGKTSILQVLLHEYFQEKMSNTLGACFHRYQSDDARGESIKMDIWDTAGQQKFRSLLTLYYKNSDAVVIVFDVNDPSSFKTVDYWARQIDANCDSVPSVVLVGNKIDLRVPNTGVSKEQVGKYLAKRSKWEYIECSAKENFNIKQIFRVVGGKLQDSLVQKEKLAQASKMKIHPSKLRKHNQSTCC